MEFADVVGENAGLEVQAVDVLRDDARELAAVLELDDAHVADVWLRELERDGLEFVLAALRLERPETGGRAVVADVGRGAEAGAGEKDDLVRLLDELGDLFALGVELLRGHLDLLHHATVTVSGVSHVIFVFFLLLLLCFGFDLCRCGEFQNRDNVLFKKNIRNNSFTNKKNG